MGSPHKVRWPFHFPSHHLVCWNVGATLLPVLAAGFTQEWSIALQEAEHELMEMFFLVWHQHSPACKCCYKVQALIMFHFAQSIFLTFSGY